MIVTRAQKKWLRHCFQSNGKPVTERLTPESKQSVDDLLTRMAKRGLLYQSPRGGYCLTGFGLNCLNFGHPENENIPSHIHLVMLYPGYYSRAHSEAFGGEVYEEHVKVNGEWEIGNIVRVEEVEFWRKRIAERKDSL